MNKEELKQYIESQGKDFNEFMTKRLNISSEEEFRALMEKYNVKCYKVESFRFWKPSKPILQVNEKAFLLLEKKGIDKYE